MIGVDTSFLVAFEILAHPLYQGSRLMAQRYQSEGFALAPQVLAEFAYIVTDPKRFERPITMSEALARAGHWWNARQTVQVVPGPAAVQQFLAWMNGLHLGRKRILDTLLAATYKAAGISLIATTNARDFALFPGMHPLLLE